MKERIGLSWGQVLDAPVMGKIHAPPAAVVKSGLFGSDCIAS
jgi:hypothetical protein